MAVFKLRRAKAARIVISSPFLVIEPEFPSMPVRRRPAFDFRKGDFAVRRSSLGFDSVRIFHPV
jgi:hypothetical protein